MKPTDPRSSRNSKHRNHEEDHTKVYPINNYFKSKWPKCYKQKTDTIRMGKKKKKQNSKHVARKKSTLNIKTQFKVKE